MPPLWVSTILGSAVATVTATTPPDAEHGALSFAQLSAERKAAEKEGLDPTEFFNLYGMYPGFGKSGASGNHISDSVSDINVDHNTASSNADADSNNADSTNNADSELTSSNVEGHQGHDTHRDSAVEDPSSFIDINSIVNPGPCARINLLLCMEDER
jgi:hypothetical protein